MGASVRKSLYVDDEEANGEAQDAAVNEVSDVDDVQEVTCIICQEEYNLDLRQPKMLHCHHTFCLSCLKVLSKLSNYDELVATNIYYFI